MSKDITDDDQIKETLEKYRQDQSRLATEVSFLRQEKLKQLKQRHEEAREKTGKSVRQLRGILALQFFYHVYSFNIYTNFNVKCIY